jgi:hypothetical protein
VSMSAWSQVRRVRWRCASQSRNTVACLICSPANRRPEGVIGVFAARARVWAGLPR